MGAPCADQAIASTTASKIRSRSRSGVAAAAASRPHADSTAGQSRARSAGQRASAGGRGGGADQAAQRLRPRRVGGAALEVERRAGRGPRARLGGLVHDLGREPALADAGDPCDGRDAAAAAHGGLERGAQDGQLGVPPAQGGPGRRGRRRGGRRGRGGRRRGRGRAAGAQPVGELAGLGRGGDPELGGQHVPAAAVGGHGLGALAGRGQAADEGAVAGLAQPVVAERPARPLDGRRRVPVGLGELGQPVERRDEAVAPCVLRLDRPLVGDLGEERARRELDRPLQRGAVAGREQPLGLLGVDPPRQVRRQARARAVGDQVVAPADGLERRPHAPQCAAQGGARAGVQDVGPEDPGQAGARHRLGAAEEVGQERPRLHAGDVRDRTPVNLDGQPPEEPSAQHPRHLGPLPTGGQSPRNEPGARDRRGDRGPTEVECVSGAPELLLNVQRASAARLRRMSSTPKTPWRIQFTSQIRMVAPTADQKPSMLNPETIHDVR